MSRRTRGLNRVFPDRFLLCTLYKGMQQSDELCLARMMDLSVDALTAWLSDRYCSDGETARGIVLETWTLAWRQRDEFRCSEHLVQWLHVVARNKAISATRSEAARRRAHRRLWEQQRARQADAKVVESGGPEEGSLLAEASLQSLPDRQREALQLRYLHNHSVKEIAVLLQCSAGSVKMALHRGRRALAYRAQLV